MGEISEILEENEEVLWSGQPYNGALKFEFKFHLFYLISSSLFQAIFIVIILIFIHFLSFFFFLPFLALSIFGSIIFMFLIINSLIWILKNRKLETNSIFYFITNKRILIKAQGEHASSKSIFSKRMIRRENNAHNSDDELIIYHLNDDNELSSRDFSNIKDFYFLPLEKIDAIEIKKSPIFLKEFFIFFTVLLENEKRNIFFFSQISEFGNFETIISRDLLFNYSEKNKNARKFFKNQEFMKWYLCKDKLIEKDLKAIRSRMFIGFILVFISVSIGFVILILNSFIYSFFNFILLEILIIHLFGFLGFGIFYYFKYKIKPGKIFDLEPKITKY